MGLKKIEQVCTNYRDLIYVTYKIEQACTNLKDPLYGYAEVM